ncbi:nitroreductase family protein [Pseudodesulfovibrio thermohalotolerans]|uniref:nitroreductase family protein n=1 Tax=Pseudodesulfovibrio thermohalotolerans TaxID=2880651 RepID=UPI002442A2E3|nr:nitroreductase family protein [Pseudodesulfovibrio thermohalotolerans]WFS61928.1 nitroreductase family protein [Pseudodesulfovibrio thermohalotolerans]
MSLFTIDETRCKRDGLCAADCPAGCIVFEKGGLPEPHEKKQAYCLDCGHCMAVCPADAIRLDRFAAGSVPLDKGLRISLDQAEQFLKGRRSMRAFRDEPVDASLLDRLLSVTGYCPSGHNARPTRWVVAHGADKVAGAAGAVAAWMRAESEADTPLAAALHLPGIVRAWDNGMDLICRNAPVLAVAVGPQRGITPREDGVIATAYLELAVSGAGLGACWCGYLVAAAAHNDGVREFLGVAAGEAVYGALMLGHPARRYTAVPPRQEPSVRWL